MSKLIKKIIDWRKPQLSLGFALTTLLVATTAQAQVCKTNNSITSTTTPDSRFEVWGDGSEVKDKRTGLIWQRCSLGQAWDGAHANCINNDDDGVTSYNWEDALSQAQALGNGYRLPNVRELASIIELQCYEPAINERIFPSTPNNTYWSSSPFANEERLFDFGSSAWGVEFQYGAVSLFDKNGTHYVRPVRSE